MRLAIIVCVAGCAYQPGSFADYHARFPGRGVTVGCVDAAIAATRSEHGTLLRFSFGNRCDRATTIDLVSVRLTARAGDGRVIQLAPFDPRSEIVRTPIDARSWGREWIEYRPLDETTSIVEVCADLSRIDGRATAPAQWICQAVERGAA